MKEAKNYFHLHLIMTLYLIQKITITGWICDGQSTI